MIQYFLLLLLIEENLHVFRDWAKLSMCLNGSYPFATRFPVNLLTYHTAYMAVVINFSCGISCFTCMLLLYIHTILITVSWTSYSVPARRSGTLGAKQSEPTAENTELSENIRAQRRNNPNGKTAVSRNYFLGVDLCNITEIVSYIA